MSELCHPNVVGLKHAFYTSGVNPNELYLNLAMEYVPDTVFKIYKHYFKMKQAMPLILVKLYSYQMLRGLAYLHALGIAHRDIKPQNLLVDPATHTLKLCDFGSAKRLFKSENNVSYISSRYYRAPELICGNRHYSAAVDMWSAGCVIAEMLLFYALFPGESSAD